MAKCIHDCLLNILNVKVKVIFVRQSSHFQCVLNCSITYKKATWLGFGGGCFSVHF